MSSYAYGEPVTLTLTDANGATASLASYAEVVLTIVQPDGTSVTLKKSDATLTANPYIFQPSQTGRHVYYYVTTTPNGATSPQPFDVEAAGSAGLVSLTDAKTQLNIDSTDLTNDAELQGFIDAATEVVEGIVGQVSRTTTTDAFVTDTANVWPYHYGTWPRYAYPNTRSVDLRLRPVISVQSVTVSAMDGTSATVLASSSYRVDTVLGTVTVIDGSAFGPLVTVAYTAGRAELPAGIRMAALLLVEHLWEQTQRGAGTGRSVPGASQDVADIPYGPTKESQALALLERYRPAATIA